MRNHNNHWLGILSFVMVAALALAMPAAVVADEAAAIPDGESDQTPAVVEESGPSTADGEFDPRLPLWGRYTIERLTPAHDRVSRWVDNTARNIDNFFGTDESFRVHNDSYLRISQEFVWEESEGFSDDLGIRFRLDVPTARENLRLIFESDPEETDGTLAEQGGSERRTTQPERSRSVVGLGRFLGRDRREAWDANINAGIRLRWPLDPYVRLTAERLWEVGEGPWMLESNNRVAWFNDDGYFARTRWDIGRRYGQRDHLRFITNLQWREEHDTLEFFEAVEWNRILGPRSVVRYAGVGIGKSGSNPRFEDFYVLMDYRRNIHREVLFLDLVPELHFPREANFDPRWMMSVRLEIYFRAAVSQREWRNGSSHRDAGSSPWVQATTPVRIHSQRP